ncbi:MAG TPA: periplasmic heavy metal sensor [Kofleriaceae bacterium]|nr:periplasmic heavy metal sensor [Kofleriaceae bacterium]
MLCFALGLGVLGFIAARKARRCGRGGGCYGHGGWHGRGGWHGHGGWPGWRGHHGRRGLYMALSHLDASPAQERAIVNEVDKLREKLWSTKRNLKDSRGDLAAAIRASELDDAALGAVLGRVDGATAEARASILEALRNIHAVLDDKQRAQLADILEGGFWRGRGGHGGPHGGHPYRV